MVGENILEFFLAVRTVVGENILKFVCSLDNAARIAEGGSKGGGPGGGREPPPGLAMHLE